MYLHKTPWLLKQLYPNLTWRGSSKEKVIYLTFDDGPVPEVSEFVLDQLQQYNAKASFFCVGKNIHKHPEILRKIIEAGHTIGNHTYNHLNGWASNDRDYLQNIKKCENLLPQNGQKLFRPPYGKVKRSQIRKLRREYQIIMWDVLTGDFDPSLNAEICFKRSINCTRRGAIVIFHDSYKAQPTLTNVLPRYLAHFSDLGYRFLAL